MKKTVQLTSLYDKIRQIAEDKGLKKHYGYGNPFSVPYQMFRALYSGWIERNELIRQCSVGAPPGAQDPYDEKFGTQFEDYKRHFEKFVLADLGYVIKEDTSLFGLTFYKLEKLP